MTEDPEMLDEARMAEYVFRLLSEAEEDQMARAIRADARLARLEGEWIDVLGNALRVDWNGPVPDLRPQLAARLFGQPPRAAARGPALPALAVWLGLGFLVVLIAKLYALSLIWPWW
jgi:hypothetical protein